MNDYQTQHPQLFTIAEVAAMSKISDSQARKNFRNFPGVIQVGQGTKRKKILIPAPVYEKWRDKFFKVVPEYKTANSRKKK